jgi:hypothetical protein
MGATFVHRCGDLVITRTVKPASSRSLRETMEHGPLAEPLLNECSAAFRRTPKRERSAGRKREQPVTSENTKVVNPNAARHRHCSDRDDQRLPRAGKPAKWRSEPSQQLEQMATRAGNRSGLRHHRAGLPCRRTLRCSRPSAFAVVWLARLVVPSGTPSRGEPSTRTANRAVRPWSGVSLLERSLVKSRYPSESPSGQIASGAQDGARFRFFQRAGSLVAVLIVEIVAFRMWLDTVSLQDAASLTALWLCEDPGPCGSWSCDASWHSPWCQ